MLASIIRPRAVTRAALLAVFAVVTLLTLTPRTSAYAHPLGNFTINRYARIEVYRDALQVHYVLDLAEIPTFQLISDIHAGAGNPTQAELDAYAAQASEVLPRGFTLTLNGEKLAVQPLERQIQLLPGQGGLQVTRLVVVYSAPAPAGSGQATITFADTNYGDRAGWKEIVVRGSEGAAVTVAPQLTMDRSDALRSYPAETLRSAPDIRDVSFQWVQGTGSPAPASATVQVAEKGRGSAGFSALLDSDRSLGIIILSLLAAFGFGALHALSPGHGKTVVAAYLVGTRGTAKHAVALGATVTATHTSTVYLLGFVTISASALITPERLQLWLGVASGALVVIFGASILAARLWRIAHPVGEGEHRHGPFGRKHAHEAHGHGPHVHEGEEGEHPHGAPAAAGVTWRSLLTLGVAGGLLPCPSAIVVMLAAIALGQVFYGMLLIVAFSLGLAGVLTGIGLVLVVGKRLSRTSKLRQALARPLVARAAMALPVLSALGVTIAGLAVTYQAWNQPGL